MSDDDHKDNPPPTSQPEQEVQTSRTPESYLPAPVQAPVQIPQTVADRAELLARARSFLSAPHIRTQDDYAKRTFLAEKGLTDTEIAILLREVPPSIPPRTYPQPPPSNLPNLLIGLARIFTWLTGTSAVIVFVYYRYILPRLTHSYHARLSLRQHQSSLLARLTDSLSALKSAQASSFADLPRPIPFKEDPRYSQCNTLDEVIAQRDMEAPDNEKMDVEDITLLRCALLELSRAKGEHDEGVSTEELFGHLESKLPWLRGDEGVSHQGDLWNTLNTNSPLFTSVPPSDNSSSTPEHPSRLLWTYVPLPIPTEPPLLPALDALRASLPRPSTIPPPSASTPPALSPTQRTLQALSDFTGYITTQTYSFSIRGGTTADPQEDEVRREIRALKGLVLNRRTFLPPGAAGGLQRPTSVPVPASQDADRGI
ncbi:hypothetical protein BV22DRAFT_46754 [Leucogyrophana mollusca]|uniref:Uncharacterized protein n=1 Tax=Leucogyrophana mollusca TaxID=85980 RepID=A0ACB8BZN3_9AGAM|nr:hypothetical protein BV22DRAFT_46754 [Leucogyrophana mollusca]